ncbi:M56 family metallopeptidase [Cyclobacterium jeungdonense]|uniref:M56 family metallopeptidase n=1 Tax=Cyclobacterium jeungdonense TaxID=708087 RepID=A0ABT8CCV3_9BACT|nr:M56 family metallopeptidase [Cyclobacterium jeungdonense]MDN3689580.1 M56 family metallopeptidase [Cyclobacterium jeungdonense]
MKIDWFLLAVPEILGWSLIHSLWQFVLLAGIYWLLLRFGALRIPHYRYLTGLLVLFLMALSFSATLWYEYQMWLHDAAIPQPHLESLLHTATGYQAETSPGHWATASLFLQKALPYFVNVWFIGVVFYMVRLAGNFASLQQIKRRSSMSLPKWIHEKARVYGLKMGITLPVSIRVSEEIEVPMVFGMLKPIVLIPAGLLSGMPPAQLETILAHELAHIRRQDFTINLCQSFLEMIFFYHPAFWWINESVREAREQATDDLAIKNGAVASDLAHALANIVNRASNSTPELAMAAQKSTFPTLLRIQRMMGKKHSKISPSPLISKTMIITCLLSFILLLGTARQENPDRNIWLETQLNNTLSSLPVSIPSFPMPLISGSDDSVPSSVTPSTLAKAEVILDSIQEFNFQIAEVVDLVVEVDQDATWEREAAVKIDTVPEMPALALSPPPTLDFSPAFPENLPGVSGGFFKEFGDSLGLVTSRIILLHQDSTPNGRFQKEKLELKMKELQLKMAASQQVFEEKMREWEADFKPKMEEFEAKMEAWRKENEPKIKEFEAKMEEWSKQQEARFKAMEEKMREKEKAMEEIQ